MVAGGPTRTFVKGAGHPASGWTWLAVALAVIAIAVSAPALERRGARILEYEGLRYYALKDLAVLYGGAYRHEGKTLTLRHSQGRFVFKPGTRRADFQGRAVWLHREPIRVGRRWAITEADVETVVGPLLRPGPVLARARAATVMLDPGHGGRDEGARGVSPRPEKDLTLDLARRVEGRLRSPGHRVLLTRGDDRYVSLDDRSELALRQRADVFVSLHFNQAANTNAAGIEVFALTAQGQPSTLDAPGETIPLGAYRGHAHQGAATLLSDALHASLMQKRSAPDRGLRRARFAVLRNAPCPATLLECGFLSNTQEAKAIATDQKMDELAGAIAHGIQGYLRAVDSARERNARTPRRESPPT